MLNRNKRIIIVSAAILAVLLILSFYFDRQISQAFASVRIFYLNQFFLGIKLIDNEILVVAFLTAILLWKKEKREWIFPLWLTVLITGIVSFILKYVVHRQRPFAQGVVSLLPGIADKASYHSWDFSFPSFDTALVFCSLPIVWKFFPRFRYVWVAFSVLVGLSRIYFGVHFMSDVLAGGIIGFLIGAWILKVEKDNGNLKRLYHRIFKSD